MDNEKNIVEFDVRLHFKEFLRFNYQFNKKSLGLFTLLGCMVIIASLAFLLPGNKSSIEMSKIIEPAAIILIILIAIYVSVYFRTKKYWNSNKTIQEVRHFIISNDGIVQNSETSNSKIAWDKVYKVDESKNIIAVYISNMQAFVIPKRCIEDEKDLTLAKRIINEKAPKRKVKLKIANKFLINLFILAVISLGYMSYLLVANNSVKKTGDEIKADNANQNNEELDAEAIYNDFIYEGYAGSLSAAEEILTHGEKGLPILEKLLKTDVRDKPEGSMYPFNAIWALARIGGEKSKKILSANIKKDPETIQQALEAIQLREKYNSRNFGVFWQGTQDLYDKLDENSKKIGTVTAGDQIEVYARHRNKEEVGPRGQEQLYLEIRILKSNIRGYLPVQGIDFDPYL